MTDSTNKDTVILDDNHIIDVIYDSENFMVQAWWLRGDEPTYLIYFEKFSEPCDYIKIAIDECRKVIPRIEAQINLRHEFLQ